MTRPPQNPALVRGRWLAAVLGGAAMVFAFPPFGLWPLALAGGAFLCWLGWRLPPGSSFRYGFLLGLIQGAGQIYWIINVLTDYGRLPWILALPVLALLVAYLAAYHGLFVWLLSWLRLRNVSPLIIAPAAWAALEWARIHLFTGFPWLLLGNAFTATPAMIQSVELWGVCGLSAAAMFTAALLAMAVGAGGPGPARRALAGGLAILILAGGYWWGSLRQEAVHTAMSQAPTLTVSVVQGNLPIEDLNNPAKHMGTVKKQLALSRGQAGKVKKRPWLVVWPESGAPFYFLNDARPTLAVLSGAGELGAGILTGTWGSVKADGKYRPTNRMWLVKPGGQPGGYYDKAHLVPFGEYVPLAKILFFVRAIAALGLDSHPGPEGHTIEFEGVPLGPLVCYESIFPELARQQRLSGARLIVNQTNDAWFGRTGASAQHLSHLVLRSVENRLAAARAANSGISCFVLPDGSVHQTIGLFVDGAATMDLPLMNQTGAYTRLGNLAGPLGAGICLVCLLWAVLRRNKRND